MKIAIGRFGRAHGVRGEIRFWPFNRDSELLAGPRSIEVGQNAQRLQTWKLERIRFDAKGAVVRFADINDRDVVGAHAEEKAGLVVAVGRAAAKARIGAAGARVQAVAAVVVA